MVDQGNARTFDARIYGKIALNDLVTYAVYYLTQIGEEITAEDIVAACFLMFPQRFSLCARYLRVLCRITVSS